MEVEATLPKAEALLFFFFFFGSYSPVSNVQTGKKQGVQETFDNKAPEPRLSNEVAAAANLEPKRWRRP